jgi:CRP/FNR family transcriptional regulator, cyclic AMP receptor protein
MDGQALWYLENIDITAILCPQKQKMAHHITQDYKKGDYIYLPDEHADKIFYLHGGKIKIGTYSNDGKEITKAILGAGEVFGELSLVGEDKRRDFAMVVEDASVCIVSLGEMQSLMRSYTGLDLFIMKIIGRRLLTMEKRLEDLVFKDSRTRIIDFLHDLATEKGRKVGYETEVRGFLTHQEIANLTATSRQTVTTVLNELKKKEVISFNRRRILVRDMSKLV